MATKTGRSGVSLEEVAEAVQELKDEGVNPSVRAIRERIGRGSNTTLLELLNKVEAGIETPEQELEQFGPRLLDLCQEMISHMKDLAQANLAKEREELEQRRENMIQRIAKAQEATEAAERDLAIERSTTKELRKKLDTMEKEHSQTQAALTKQTLINAEVKTDLRAMTARAERAESDAKDARVQRDHFEERAAMQRKDELERHAHQTAILQQAIESGHRNETRLAEQLSEERQEAQRLASAVESLRADLEAARALVPKLQSEISSLEVKAQEQSLVLSSQAEQLDAVRRSHDAKTDHIAELQSRMIELNSQYESARAKDHVEHKSAIALLVEHSNRTFEHSRVNMGEKEESVEFSEIRAAHEQVLKLFG